jgi:hypothetical protein
MGVSNQYVQYNGGRGVVSNDAKTGAYRIAGSGGYEVRSLLRFEGLQSMAGRRVLKAEMLLTFNWGSSGYTLNAQVLNRPWNAANAAFGWSNADAGQPWAIPGSGGADWVTGGAIAITGFVSNAADVRTIALPAALVQQWIDQPQTNHGLALVPTAAGKVSWLRSSEDSEPQTRPTLRVWLQ